MTIGTLGPKGTYSGQAVRQYDLNAEIKYYETITDVIDAFLRGEVDCVVVPAENSIEGSVTTTLDLLAKHHLKIVGETIVHIRHCLLFKGKIEDVKMIYTHPQAKEQCSNYVRKNFPGIKVYDDSSTASAAQKALTTNHIAAIASEEAARVYGLKIFAKDIQKVNGNHTRFFVIGRNISVSTKHDKTSILVFPKENRAGALYEILGEFAQRNIDLSRIESRTAGKKLNEYMFFIDIKGNMNNPKIHKALQEVEKQVEKIIIFGSYQEDRSYEEV